MRRRSFSLIELLVATAILTVLGTSLVLILRGGLNTWRKSEARREAFDQGQAVLLQLREDLSSLNPPFDTPLSDGGEVESRLLAERGTQGRARLLLVRSIKAESEHPITGLAGRSIGADAFVDQRNDVDEARDSRLRATGGAMEVAWILGQEGILYRGVRSPIGGSGSLFHQGLQNPASLLQPFASRVIHLEFLFWTQYSTTWNTKHAALRDPEPDEESGPLKYWDSTRALLEPVGARPREFHTFRARRSLGDSRDDILPVKIRILLVVDPPQAAELSTFLLAPLTDSAREFRVQDPARLSQEGGFLYVGGEWIHYSSVTGNLVEVPRGGRGARGTTAKAHDGSQPLSRGQAFQATFDVPAYREDWRDRSR